MRIFFYWLLDMLFPGRCMLCRKFLTEKETDICRECTVHMESYPFGFFNKPPSGKNKAHFLDSFTAVWYYEGDVRRSILRYKFSNAVYLAPKFGKMVAMKLLQEGLEQIDILTWVPVSSMRRFKRGYDQCELLAKYVGKELGIPCVKVLKKVRNNPPQSGLRSADQRKANVLGAYQLCRKADLSGKRIVLLDDIFTTGATMDECARTLLTAGAKEVHGAAIAAAHYHKFSSR